MSNVKQMTVEGRKGIEVDKAYIERMYALPDKEEISGFECRFAIHIPPPKELVEERGSEVSDYTLVKEMVHCKDGRVIPHVRILKDFKRPFYVTKVRYRDHEQKREKESLEKLDKWESTEWALKKNVAIALGERNYKGDPRKLMSSPYLYGTDLSSTAYLKEQYRKRWPGLTTYFNVAVYDIETDMVEGSGRIIMATLSYKDKLITCVLKDYVRGFINVEEAIRSKANSYLKEHIEKRKINLDVRVCDTPGEIVATVFGRAHEWRPDWVAVWNIGFDLPRSIEALKKDGIRPEDVFSDPLVPREYRRFWFKEGPKIRTTNLGVTKNLAPYEQWHWVHTPASFLFIDSMCVYYLNRIAEQNEPSYKLDYLLNKHLGLRKLKFEEANHLPDGSPAWHRFMQSQYKLEYVVYHMFDCIGVEEFDEKVLDLCLTTPMAAGCMDFSRFNSQPQRLLAEVYWFLHQRGYIVGNGQGVEQEYDKLTISLRGWICTMPSHLIKEKGLRCLKL